MLPLKMLMPKTMVVKMKAWVFAIALLPLIAMTVRIIMHIKMALTIMMMVPLVLLMVTTVAPMLPAILIMTATTTNRIILDKYMHTMLVNITRLFVLTNMM